MPPVFREVFLLQIIKTLFLWAEQVEAVAEEVLPALLKPAVQEVKEELAEVVVEAEVEQNSQLIL